MGRNKFTLTNEQMTNRLSKIKEEIIVARRAGDDEKAAILSGEKQVIKKKIMGRCVDCGATIHKNHIRCPMHARTYRYYGRAVAALLVALWVPGCASPWPASVPPAVPSTVQMELLCQRDSETMLPLPIPFTNKAPGPNGPPTNLVSSLYLTFHNPNTNSQPWVVETATNMLAPKWVLLSAGTVGGNGDVFIPLQPSAPKAFYRAGFLWAGF